MARKAKISRKTKETSISVSVNLDGKGKYKIDTGIGFLNHMLEQLSKHSSIDMNIKAKGDTHIDLHHTTEDTGIAIGEALKKASKKFVGIKRYAHLIRHVTNLIEKQRAALGEFKSTFSASNSTGKRALFVAEQFALEQLAGNGAAVNRDKRTICAFRAIMNQARNDFFTGSGFALE